MGESLTAGSIWALFLLITGVMALLLPFFVFRIRNEMISMNRKMGQLLAILGGQQEPAAGELICLGCGARNRRDAGSCRQCREPLV